MSSEQELARAEQDAEHERGLFFGITASRLRSRARWASVVLMFAALLPYDAIDGSPLFLWDLASELAPAAIVAALAMPLAGLAILIALIMTKRAASLAAAVLGALLAVAVLRKLGAERSAWDAVSLPESLSARPAGALSALALTAAAANLSFRRHTQKLVPFAVGAAGIAALYYYAWPGRGEAPLVAIGRALAFLPELPDFRYQLGTLMLVSLTLWPLLVTLMGVLLLRAPASKDEGWLSLVANWSFTAWLLLLAYRTLIMSQATVALVGYLGGVAIVTGVVALMSASIGALVEGFFVEHGDEVPLSRSQALAELDAGPDPFTGGAARPAASERAGLPTRVACMVAGGAVVVLGAAQAVLARPPEKGTEWTLSERSDGADRVYGELLLDWGRTRRNWDFAVRHESGAQERLDVKASGKDLVKAAKELDPEVGAAFEALTEESDDLDLAGRKFARLVTDLNDATRKAKLPYFVDGSVALQETKEGFRRHFFAFAYRIEGVNRWDVDGRELATLQVRQLGHQRDSHVRLGFSRDADPFALVVLDVTDTSAADFAATAAMGDCTDQPVFHSELYSGLGKCGELVKAAFAGQELEMRAAVVAATERHELQHQIDGPHLPLASAVSTRLAGYAPDYQDRVNREVSAFLAEMTAEGFAPRLTLWHLAKYQLSSDQGTYPRTALICFESLVGRSILHGHEVDGDKLWEAWRELFGMGDDELRVRAQKTWKELYDAELPTPKKIE